MVAGLTPTGAATLPRGCADRVDLRLIIDGSILELVAADVVTATVRLPAPGGGRTISCTPFGGQSIIRAAELRTLEPRRQSAPAMLSRGASAMPAGPAAPDLRAPRISDGT
jgi:hypothetical protein